MAGGVLFPNERVRGHGVKVMKTVCLERPQLQESAFQQIKGHQ
jgi:hypothetical protein